MLESRRDNEIRSKFKEAQFIHWQEGHFTSSQCNRGIGLKGASVFFLIFNSCRYVLNDFVKHL